MATGAELATAWVRLVPTMEGVQGETAKAFLPAQKEAEDAGDKAGKGFSTKTKAAITAGSAVLVAGVVAGFKGLYEIGDTFDAVTDTIRTGTGLQGEALEGLVDVAKNVGSKVPADFEKIGSTVADLNTRLGLSGDVLDTVASQYLEAGRILGQDVDIQATTAAFNAFGIEGAAVEGAMDSLFQVSQATGVGMNELAGVVQSVAPALQNLGFSFEESAALAGTLDKAGLNASAVMASMSKGMVTLAKDGEAPQEAFARVTAELQGFVDTGDTASALDLAGQVFGTKGAAQFVGALQSGTLNMEDLMAATGATGDTILGVGEETMDFAEKAQILGNQAMTALEPLATTLFNGIGDALTAMMPAVEAFSTWISENEPMLGVLAIAIGVVTAAIIAANVAMWAMAMNPIVLLIMAIVIAVVALIAAVVWLVLEWDNVVAWLSEVWAGFVSWFTGVMDGFISWWNGMWEGFASWITDVWNGFIGWIMNVWNGFISWIMGVLNGFVGWWNGIWSGFGSWITNIWNGLVNGIRGLWSGFVGWIMSNLSGFVGWWNGIWSGVGDVINRVFSGIGSFINGVWNGIVSGIKSAVNSIIRVINGAIDGVNGIIGAAGAAFGISLKIPRIPMLAKGGTVTGSGSVIVGEKGPELLTLPAGAQVNPDYDEVPHSGVTFNNYAPLGQTPSQALDEFANRSEVLFA